MKLKAILIACAVVALLLACADVTMIPSVQMDYDLQQAVEEAVENIDTTDFDALGA